ncbi:MAG: hypothetical protein ACLT98_12810 [Eggerthellaceae bacterium]
MLVVAHRTYGRQCRQDVVLNGGAWWNETPAELRENPESRYRRMLELQRASSAWSVR